MDNKYKLICIDMDGTLLNSKHEVSDENRLAIQEAMDKGIIVAITTGRLFTSANMYSNQLSLNGPVISLNGSYVRKGDSDKHIYKSPLTYEEAKIIYDILEKNNISIYYYNTFDSVLTKNEMPEDHPYRISNNKLSEENRINFRVNGEFDSLIKEVDGEILKVIAIDNEDREKILNVKKQFLDLDQFEVVSSLDTNFEIMKKGSSKGQAVKRLAESLGIKREEVVCIGDNENDLSMIRYAGLGVAMSNGSDILKKECDYITDTNENNGVAKIINKIIK